MDAHAPGKHQQQQQTAFRQSEKLYSRRDKPLDLRNIIDFNDPDTLCARVAGVSRIQLTHDLETPPSLPFEAYRAKRLPAYALEAHPGLMIIPDALTDEAQRWLARKCLCDCARPPNRTNLDPFFEMPEESLFTLAHTPSSQRVAENLSEAPRTIHSRVESGSVQTDVTVPRSKAYTQAETPERLLGHLRWCTLGQQYNWTTKNYDLGTSPFDPDLNALMKSIALAITHPSTAANNLPYDANAFDGRLFCSQAGIVNYYGSRTTMAGHVDKTEETMDAPLISLSIGLSCIYLVGGPTRDTSPAAMYLRSGDILAMCGESRLAFHGVPRVFSDTCPLYLASPKAGVDDAEAANYPDWCHFGSYLANHRINCNARKCS
ncbi:hypothetical protein LPJ64_000577 [Coemansia asiatica]|uniref:Alpha-ketoglutarate-dependent dioxygenase AlkB-like domain-containing protein n=1 Tax=Coemansia asiatica TaxID=1052880 RepID=A0A9W7XRB6_9FUNG|nr:hypothetical protein LPJ64_000577 [Coemansia asiatica]KAJ2862315.1 hypothetical protein FB639_005403 [Coemansia asiatica]